MQSASLAVMPDSVLIAFESRIEIDAQATL